MKKLFALVFAVLLLVSIPFEAFAETPDFSALSDEELHALIDGARNELATRELVAGEKVVLLDVDGVQVYLTGNYEVTGYDSAYLKLEVVLVNNTDKEIGVTNYGASINGWEVYSMGFGNASPGKKMKGTFDFSLTDAEISTYEEVEDIDMTLEVYDGSTYSTIYEADTITLHFNG